MRKIGLIINPYAGIGGKVALKGSDGADIIREAFALGAKPESEEKVIEAFSHMHIEENFIIVTASGKMGERAMRKLGIPHEVIFASDIAESSNMSCNKNLMNGCEVKQNVNSHRIDEPDDQMSAKSNQGILTETTSQDTKRYARAMKEQGAELLLFAGGDGTARDIMDAVGDEMVVIGIPTGCKIHSGVYARTPLEAVRILERCMRQKDIIHAEDVCEGEVMDIDEEAFREGRLQAKLYGYMKVASDERMQNKKAASGRVRDKDQAESLCGYVAELMKKEEMTDLNPLPEVVAFDKYKSKSQRDALETQESDTLYIVGGGSTTMQLKRMLEQNTRGIHQKRKALKENGFNHSFNRNQKENPKATLLGVDLILNGKIIQSDCTEQDILNALSKHEKAKVIVTVIGGQGYVFGRGNQQISAKVLKKVGKDNIMIIATPNKIQQFFGKRLYADTGNSKVNEMIRGYYRVITGYDDFVMMKVDA